MPGDLNDIKPANRPNVFNGFHLFFLVYTNKHQPQYLQGSSHAGFLLLKLLSVSIPIP